MRKIAAVIAGLFAMVAAMPASAATIFLDSVTQEGDLYRYNYGLQFASNEGVADGSSFAILDFAGYIADSISSAYPFVTASTELLTTDLPLGPGASDDFQTTNLRFTYNGPATDLSNLTIVGFSALSRFVETRFDGFTAQTANGNIPGSSVFAQGETVVPVPEAATWAMMICGFGMIGASMRRRRVDRAVRFA